MDDPEHAKGRDRRRALLSRLARIEGQVRGLRQMVEGDRYTGEVIQQTTAIKAALREVALLCFEDGAVAGARQVSEAEGDGDAVGGVLQVLNAHLHATLARSSGEGDASAEPPVAPVMQSIRELLKSEPTSILLVEDDPIAAEVLKTGLDQLGCSVTVASTGEDALKVLHRDDCAVDWLLADIVLPGRVDGWTVGDEFRVRNPYGRVVYISAYEQKDLSRKPSGSAFLNKPVRPAQLLEVFRSLEAA
jgi:two-component system, OmpR family, response regulator